MNRQNESEGARPLGHPHFLSKDDQCGMPPKSRAKSFWAGVSNSVTTEQPGGPDNAENSLEL